VVVVVVVDVDVDVEVDVDVVVVVDVAVVEIGQFGSSTITFHVACSHMVNISARPPARPRLAARDSGYSVDRS
jgi:hypothetical protein